MRCRVPFSVNQQRLSLPLLSDPNNSRQPRWKPRLVSPSIGKPISSDSIYTLTLHVMSVGVSAGNTGQRSPLIASSVAAHHSLICHAAVCSVTIHSFICGDLPQINYRLLQIDFPSPASAINPPRSVGQHFYHVLDLLAPLVGCCCWFFFFTTV